MKQRLFLITIALCASCAIGSPRPQEATQTSSSSDLHGVAGVVWSAPRTWTVGPARPLRLITYRILGVGGKDDGECAVYYFGPGRGGSVADNIKRWIGQMQQPNGSSTARVTQVEVQRVRGFPITRVDIPGTYMPSPRIQSGANPIPNYRLLGAILELPGGKIFFKLTAPEEAAEQAKKQFDAMLRSVGVPEQHQL